MMGKFLDTLLEETVVGSYTNVGYYLRRPWWDDADLDVDMTGKVCLVTGANAGLGYATSEALAARGATVVMLARHAERGRAARERLIERTGNPHATLELADMSHLASVREFAVRFAATYPRLDLLIHNAGVLPRERRLSPEGIELTCATNVVGPFLLTQLLVPLLERSAPARVIWVSSGGMYTQKLDVDALPTGPTPFNGVIAYAQTKRAQVILSELWAERLAGGGITVNAMHPGWADTRGMQASLPLFHQVSRAFLRTSQQGADTIVWLAVASAVAGESGKFWFDRRPRSPYKLGWGRSASAERQRLWALCEELAEREKVTAS